jgi:hypothetical protein
MEPDLSNPEFRTLSHNLRGHTRVRGYDDSLNCLRDGA